jgi:alpha-beta hydrolase superfamily lysophospholipase
MNEPTSNADAPPPAEAGWFGPEERPRFGWLHRAAQPSAAALVIVPPFGYEAVCAHRSLRHLAEDSAHAGVTAVRFDLDGTGDSAGDDLDPGRVEAWLASIDDACNLARTAGATRIVLAGVRLGAALATLAALRRDDMAGLALINPIIKGKAFLREARALQAALGLAPAPTPVNDGVQELVGFAISAETQGSLAAIDLTALEKSPAPSVLLIERDDMPANDALPARLRELGTEVETRRLPGYAEMMLDPHNALVPRAILDAVTAFALSRVHEGAPVRSGPAALAPEANFETPDGKVVECGVHVDERLFGIASGPPGGSVSSALILLNAGAIGRGGPNRMHVTLARMLATRGQLALRLDQCGLGDSSPRPGEPENVVYAQRALADIEAAIAWVRRQGAREVCVAGLCSGAYHAFKAACAGQPVDRIIMVDPLTFDYRPGMPLDFAAFRVTADVQRYGTSVRNAAAWRKVLRGEVDLLRAMRVMAYRVGHLLAYRLRDVARALGLHLRGDLGGELLKLARRGVAVNGIFAASDPGWTMLREQGGGAVTRLRREGRLTVEVIDGADHTFTPRWTQRLYIDAVLRALAPAATA